MKKPKAKKVSITITRTARDVKYGDMSLGYEIEKAARVFAGRPVTRKERDWLIRSAIRAVCDLITKTGHITSPMRLQWADGSAGRKPVWKWN